MLYSGTLPIYVSDTVYMIYTYCVSLKIVSPKYGLSPLRVTTSSLLPLNMFCRASHTERKFLYVSFPSAKSTMMSMSLSLVFSSRTVEPKRPMDVTPKFSRLFLIRESLLNTMLFSMTNSINLTVI